jgi:hemerythrin
MNTGAEPIMPCRRTYRHGVGASGGEMVRGGWAAFGGAGEDCPRHHVCGIAGRRDQSEALMSIITWTPALSVGIAAFDAEHRTLLAMFNELFAVIGAGDGGCDLGGLIDNIVEYTAKHFANEESYLTKFQYPQLASHLTEHRRLSAEAAEIRRRYLESSGAVPIMDVFMFFRTGLIRHFYNVDPLYTKFLQAHGLS